MIIFGAGVGALTTFANFTFWICSYIDNSFGFCSIFTAGFNFTFFNSSSLETSWVDSLVEVGVEIDAKEMGGGTGTFGIEGTDPPEGTDTGVGRAGAVGIGGGTGTFGIDGKELDWTEGIWTGVGIGFGWEGTAGVDGIETGRGLDWGIEGVEVY